MNHSETPNSCDPVDSKRIVDKVLALLGVSHATLVSQERRGTVVFARSLVCHILHKSMGYSYAECRMIVRPDATSNTTCIDAVSRLHFGSHDDQATKLDPTCKTGVELANKIYQTTKEAIQ